MSKHSYHRKTKKRHLTRKVVKGNKGRKSNKGRKNSKTLKQKGGGILFELIPSDMKQFGYFFENIFKFSYKYMFGMP